MAVDILLHSGQFVTQEDDVVTVTFYRKTGINAVPRHLEFGASGGTQTIEIWSRTGEVILRINPDYYWLDYRQVEVTPITGTDYHKYTYNITCTENQTDHERIGTLDIGIEYGQGVGDTVQVPVIQSTDASTSSVTVVPYSITYLPSGGTYGITATFTGTEPTFELLYVQGTPGWLTQNGSGSVTDDRKECSWTADTNYTGESRTAKINVWQDGEIKAVVGIVQSSGTISEYYIKWTPYLSSGSFSINGTYYDFSDYSSCYFTSSDFSGVITTGAFNTGLYYSGIQTLETNAEHLSANAFGECTALSEISLSNCTYIGDNAFQMDANLKEINLPVCSMIGSSAFQRCTNLSMVNLPMCERIKGGTFKSCFRMSGMVILSICSEIGYRAFQSCYGLSTIILGSSAVCSLYDSYVFRDTYITNSTGSILVPSSLVSDYKNDSVWGYFSDRIYSI